MLPRRPSGSYIQAAYALSIGPTTARNLLQAMLQIIRNRAGSWIVKVLFGILIISFGIWGIGDIFRDRGPRQTIAEVGSLTIEADAVQRTLRSQVERLRQFLGPDFDVSAAVREGLLSQVVNDLVTGALIDLQAADLGIAPPDSLVAQRIRQQSAFRSPLTGQFDRDLFLRMLYERGMSEAAYVEQMRQGIGRELVATAVTGGVTAPAVLADNLYRRRRETRTAETVTIAAGQVTGIPEPAAADLSGWYDAHHADYMAPEYRVLTVLSLTAQRLVDRVSVTEQELRDAYQSRIDRFRTPERRRFDQVVLGRDQRELAERITAAARGGVSLHDAISQLGATPAVIPLDWTSQADMLPAALGAAGFALPEGGVSDPIESPFGWHVLALTGVQAPTQRSFEEVHDELEATIRLERARDLLADVSNRFDEVLASGATLEEAAGRVDLTPIQTPPLAQDGTTRDGAAVPAIPDLPRVLTAAFSQTEGAESPLIETQEGNLFVVRVDRVVAPALRPLDEVRDPVVAAWTAARRAEAATALAETLAERMRQGESAEQIAAGQPAATAGNTPALLRDGSNRGELPTTLVNGLFSSAVGAVTVAAAGSGNQIVARLTAITAAEPPTGSDAQDSNPEGAALTQIRTETARTMTVDLVAQLTDALRARYRVSIDQQALARLADRSGS